MRARAAVGMTIAALVLVGTSAAAWTCTTPGLTNAKAGTLAGNKPTLTKSGAVTLSITINWPATLGAAGYLVQRTGGVGSIGGTCTGTVTATSCTDSPVLPLQTYSYTVTPRAGSWLGTASPATTVAT
jgi:hypothetical protein